MKMTDGNRAHPFLAMEGPGGERLDSEANPEGCRPAEGLPRSSPACGAELDPPSRARGKACVGRAQVENGMLAMFI